MKNAVMFENYPDVVEVDDLRKMLGGISRKLAYRLLADQEIRSVRVGRAYKIPKVCVIEYLLGEECLRHYSFRRKVRCFFSICTMAIRTAMWYVVCVNSRQICTCYSERSSL